MSNKMEMTLGISLLMSEIIEKLLYVEKEENGQKVFVDRKIPFRLRYRLNKNRVMLEKDAQVFNRQRMLYLAQYGTPTEDGKNVVIKDEHNLELYKAAVGALVDTKVNHELMTLEPEDLELINDCDIEISPDAMALFIGYLTNDPELEKDLATIININPVPVENNEEKPAEAKASKPKRTKTQKKIENILEGKPVLDGVEGETKPKKTTRKKKETTDEQ